jgi:hypothetical protein
MAAKRQRQLGEAAARDAERAVLHLKSGQRAPGDLVDGCEILRGR